MEELRLSLAGESPDRGLWTGPYVALWIAQKIGRERVGKQRGWEYLKKCGYSPQRPRPQHKNGDKIEQENFKKNCLSRVMELQKEFPSHQIEVWSFDEHRVGLKPIIRKVWAPEKDHRQLFVIATNGYIFTDLSILLLEKPKGLSFPESTVNG